MGALQISLYTKEQGKWRNSNFHVLKKWKRRLTRKKPCSQNFTGKARGHSLVSAARKLQMWYVRNEITVNNDSNENVATLPVT